MVGRWNPRVDGEHAAHVLSGAVALATLSVKEPEENDLKPFLAMQELLKQAYPTLFSAAHAQTVAGGSLLMLLPGAQKARPLLFLCHLDVMPVEEADLPLWEKPPFSGEVAGGYVWGRGAWEGKGRLIALCEAAEALLKNGWRPSADIWFAFSQDAEVFGASAKQMCRILQAQGAEPAFILDGGGAVEEGFAKVGVAEKGYANISLSISGKGGYAAAPGAATDLDKLMLAAARAAKKPMKPMLCKPSEWMFRAMAPHMDFFLKGAYSYPGFFLPILRLLMQKGRIPQAELRSTAVLTMVRASGTADMLPRQPMLTFHCRILPGETVEQVISHLRKAAGPGDIRLVVEGAEQPSGLSPASGAAWEALSTAIQILFPDAVPVPCLNYHTTDARCYEELSGNIYRFTPFRVKEGEGLRAVNERISIANLELGIQYYQQMLQA